MAQGDRRWPRALAKALPKGEGGGGWNGPGRGAGKGGGQRAGGRSQAGAARTAVQVARASPGLASRCARQALEVPRAFAAYSSSEPRVEWEGGGWASAPPSPPAVTGAITLLAADGYQLARASVSRLPSLLRGTASSILARAQGSAAEASCLWGPPEAPRTLRAALRWPRPAPRSASPRSRAWAGTFAVAKGQRDPSPHAARPGQPRFALQSCPRPTQLPPRPPGQELAFSRFMLFRKVSLKL
ncbi:PREDICTED: glycine, alanine and asparagine-rich protein-like [Chinchilla lanigera]|uniref:glycine, alanine and asparagine-rich protein-like n=1 Tax=Chinchilla lanigera TaxID=34839 RepID=UPI0006967B06|nr:PREDICTED: glycine, alanine and asparagine-rich protein-like [Chinchilla lanigera]